MLIGRGAQPTLISIAPLTRSATQRCASISLHPRGSATWPDTPLNVQRFPMQARREPFAAEWCNKHRQLTPWRGHPLEQVETEDAATTRSDDDDAGLIARAREGDAAAYAKLVERYQDLAFRTAYL